MIYEKLKGDIEDIDSALRMFSETLMTEARQTLQKKTVESPVILTIQEDSRIQSLKQKEKEARKRYNTSILTSNEEAKELQKEIKERKKRDYSIDE